MSTGRGHYYDGKSSRRHEVSLSREGEALRLRGEGVDISYPCRDVKVLPRIGQTRRVLRFPDGAQCDIINAFSLDEVIGLEEAGFGQRLVGRLERNLLLTLLSLTLMVIVIFVFIKFGIPAVARQVAFTIPPATENTLGKETLAILDKMVFKPSQLSETKRQEVTALFGQLQAIAPETKGYRLEFRAGERIGANAMALPAGIIVVTDALVNLSRADGELAGVLAHEMGHERDRHALRHILQNSGTGVLIAAITGDILSITSLSAALPTFLIDAGYSREFEHEADDAAVELLLRRGIAPKHYADMLGRLQVEHDKKGKTEKGGKSHSLLELFASHPDTAERIRRVRERSGVSK